MANAKKQDDFSPTDTRIWAVKKAQDIAEAKLDISRLTDPEYLASLTPEQAAKIKKVITDREGTIVSVELVGMVDIIVAAANISGATAEAAAMAKQKAAEAAAAVKEKEKEKQNQHRSNKLTLVLTGDRAKNKKNPDEKADISPAEKKSLTSLAQLGEKK
jgi:hypothetical protein